MKTLIYILNISLISFSGFSQNKIIANGCSPSTSQTELNINNVRTTILGAGDMWWNLDNSKYEVPKGSGKNSMFSGALWIGGIDDQGNLKVAGMTYRQDGNDFWPGPLNSNYGSKDYGTTSADVCQSFDRHWSVYKNDVIQYRDYLDCLNDVNCDVNIAFANYSVPEAIINWPAQYIDNDGNTAYLAPFVDANEDGEYTQGVDYPEYNLDGNISCADDNTLFGDQTLWWVFNDNGNIHTETGSESAIGLEIQAQAFAFSTSNPLNDMTFYNYKIINRSMSVLNNTYFGQWVDPDLGNYQDDYVGCDVGLGLGYCYNGDADDDGTAGYNYDSDSPPPAIGVDFFRGPLADIGDGVDNDRDGEIDEPGEQVIMSKFVYYNNDFSDHGNPENATHYYGYLRGIWKNGQPMTYGGTGWESSNPECNFMFPGTTDPSFSEEWTEITAGNDPADRRFLQSAGPFTLEPGAVNYITTGVVWARANEGNNFDSVEKLKENDQFAQDLFDICFDFSQLDPELFGCTDPIALNFDPDAVYNDYSCIFEGCTDPIACNYEYFANLDDGSCKYCFTNKPYPIIGIFNNSSLELMSSSVGSGYFDWDGENTLSEASDLSFVCLAAGDTCPSNPSFLIDNLDIETLLEIEANSNNNWIRPLPDIDRYLFGIDTYADFFARFLRPQNWIRSGTDFYSSSSEVEFQYQNFGDISIVGSQLDPNGSTNQQNPLDPNQIYEYNGNAWLTPYKLLSSDYRGNTSESSTTNELNSIDTIGGGLAWKDWKSECSLDNLFNVDIVLTPDKDLWTRCPVLDMSEVELIWTGNGPPTDNNQVSNNDWFSGDEYGSWDLGDGTGEYGENKWDIRMDLNVDKYGSPDGTGSGFNSENGWGWFPGYAINTTTGERLNLMFSENSSLGELYNANDMLFNPTPYIYDFGIGDAYFQSATTTTLNGGHAVFILDTEYQGDNHEDNPHYYSYIGTSSGNAWNSLRKKQVIEHIQWAGNWLSSETNEWLSSPITIQVRIEGGESESILNDECQCVCFGDDADNDSVCDDVDNCAFTYNPDQLDYDNDGIGDECDPTPFSIEELNLQRKLIKSFDLLGRDATKRGYKIELYDDGSVEKKYILK
jgi:hypothetical protein